MTYNEKISYLTDCIISEHNYFIIRKIEQYKDVCEKVMRGELEEGHAVELYESLSRVALVFNKAFTACDLLQWYYEVTK